MAEILEFDHYAPDRFVRLTAALAAKGLELTGNSGLIQRLGANIAYTYAGATLTVKVNNAPVFHGESAFCGELRTFIESQQ